ncbi:phosphoglycolate phosphatase [Paraburkholderia aromaticivorans]|uniref:phosphoglycolate phosphatase n=1 Tax=Paraburkholderia aromaticivorans TaxID=2026199 RepID=UPI00145613EE|nr:phosphoglycolate phosphatase [Paraburkholderia aromaticivorans]
MQVMSRNLPVDAVLFDLDGTLLHTSPDIGSALNRALTERGLSALSTDVTQTLIGGGSAVLVQRAFAWLGAPHEAHTHDLVLRRYETCYQSICQSADGYQTQLFEGVEAALDGLRQMGLKLGLVTNKEQRFVAPLLQRFGLSAWFDIIVDGNTLAQRKPDPAPLLHACDALGVEPAHTLYVGDSVNDALAAQAAGMAMICVSYGYSADHPVSELPCLRVIDDLAELPELIGGPRRWRQRTHSASAAYRADEQASPWI